MLFTQSLEKRRRGISRTAIEGVGKAVAERERCGDGDGGYMAAPYSEERVWAVTIWGGPDLEKACELFQGPGVSKPRPTANWPIWVCP
jgi:hypothetical protein